MSYILDALKKAEAERERERGQVPGLNASTSASSMADDDASDAKRLPSWVWAALGALVTLVAALMWTLVERDAPPPTVQTPPAMPGVSAQAPAANTTAAPPAFDNARPLPTAPRPAPATTRAAAPKAPGPELTPQTDNDRIHALNELPDAIRQSLPTLQFGGAMYSDQASSRLLIINNQGFREGDKVAPDLILKEIKLRSAVLSYKGYAYLVSY